MSKHPIAEYAKALRQHLTQDPPTDGFRLVDVRAEIGTEATTGDEVAVVFTWRRNPHTFVVRFGRTFEGPFGDVEDLPDGQAHPGAWPEGHDPLEAWCQDVHFWLMEELDTGLLARATRHWEGEMIALTAVAPQPVPTEPDPDEVWIDDVPQYAPEMRLPWRVHLRLAARTVLARLRGRRAVMGWATWGPLDAEPGDGLRDGKWLADAGMDPAAVRAIRDDGRLLVWLQALTDALEVRPAGQCAVLTTDDPHVARMEVLEVTDRAPEGLRHRLVLAGVRAAADEGARTVLVPDGRGGEDAVDTALC
ncbi:hypothetical protein ACQBJO_09675 [Janibacter sp. G349]|uniref:hypothetical protein n=1 Tax=Janibacter sp. G349 TaxID=3405424 RepID=UPI003B7FB80F